MKIEDATAADLPAILAIYNEAVQHTTAIWNETLVDLANRQAWLNERNAAGFPVLVAHNDAGDVVGVAPRGEALEHPDGALRIRLGMDREPGRDGQSGAGLHQMSALHGMSPLRVVDEADATVRAVALFRG